MSLQQFLEGASVGEYETRLRLLLAFHCHALQANAPGKWWGVLSTAMHYRQMHLVSGGGLSIAMHYRQMHLVSGGGLSTTVHYRQTHLVSGGGLSTAMHYRGGLKSCFQICGLLDCEMIITL